MASKKRRVKKKATAKKRRTPAQIAATKKLVALNKARRSNPKKRTVKKKQTIRKNPVRAVTTYYALKSGKSYYDGAWFSKDPVLFKTRKHAERIGQKVADAAKRPIGVVEVKK